MATRQNSQLSVRGRPPAIRHEWGIITFIDEFQIEVARIIQNLPEPGCEFVVVDRRVCIGARRRFRVGDTVKLSIQGDDFVEIHKCCDWLRDVELLSPTNVIVFTFVSLADVASAPAVVDRTGTSYRLLDTYDFAKVAMHNETVEVLLGPRHPLQPHPTRAFRIGVLRDTVTFPNGHFVHWRLARDTKIVPLFNAFQKEETFPFMSERLEYGVLEGIVIEEKPGAALVYANGMGCAVISSFTNNDLPKRGAILDIALARALPSKTFAVESCLEVSPNGFRPTTAEPTVYGSDASIETFSVIGHAVYKEKNESNGFFLEIDTIGAIDAGIEKYKPYLRVGRTYNIRITFSRANERMPLVPTCRDILFGDELHISVRIVLVMHEPVYDEVCYVGILDRRDVVDEALLHRVPQFVAIPHRVLAAAFDVKPTDVALILKEFTVKIPKNPLVGEDPSLVYAVDPSGYIKVARKPNYYEPFFEFCHAAMLQAQVRLVSFKDQLPVLKCVSTSLEIQDFAGVTLTLWREGADEIVVIAEAIAIHGQPFFNVVACAKEKSFLRLPTGFLPGTSRFKVASLRRGVEDERNWEKGKEHDQETMSSSATIIDKVQKISVGERLGNEQDTTAPRERLYSSLSTRTAETYPNSVFSELHNQSMQSVFETTIHSEVPHNFSCNETLPVDGPLQSRYANRTLQSRNNVRTSVQNNNRDYYMQRTRNNRELFRSNTSRKCLLRTNQRDMTGDEVLEDMIYGEAFKIGMKTFRTSRPLILPKFADKVVQAWLQPWQCHASEIRSKRVFLLGVEFAAFDLDVYKYLVRFLVRSTEVNERMIVVPFGGKFPALPARFELGKWFLGEYQAKREKRDALMISRLKGFHAGGDGELLPTNDLEEFPCKVVRRGANNHLVARLQMKCIRPAQGGYKSFELFTANCGGLVVVPKQEINLWPRDPREHESYDVLACVEPLAGGGYKLPISYEDVAYWRMLPQMVDTDEPSPRLLTTKPNNRAELAMRRRLASQPQLAAPLLPFISAVADMALVNQERRIQRLREQRDHRVLVVEPPKPTKELQIREITPDRRVHGLQNCLRMLLDKLQYLHENRIFVTVSAEKVQIALDETNFKENTAAEEKKKRRPIQSATAFIINLLKDDAAVVRIKKLPDGEEILRPLAMAAVVNSAYVNKSRAEETLIIGLQLDGYHFDDAQKYPNIF